MTQHRISSVRLSYNFSQDVTFYILDTLVSTMLGKEQINKSSIYICLANLKKLKTCAMVIANGNWHAFRFIYSRFLLMHIAS